MEDNLAKRIEYIRGEMRALRVALFGVLSVLPPQAADAARMAREQAIGIGLGTATTDEYLRGFQDLAATVVPTRGGSPRL